MALIGYDPKRQGDAHLPPRLRKSTIALLEPTIMVSRIDLPRVQSDRALRLIPLMGGGLSRTFVVRETETILGRQMGAGLRVWDGKVSRQHCKILLTEQTAILVDMASSNGTFVNDEQIERAELRDGDLIRLGDTVLRVRYMDFIEQKAADDAYWLATRDPGTELYNRQYVLEALQREIVRANQRGFPITLLLAGIDLPGAPRENRLALLDKEARALGTLLQREGGEDLLVGRYSTGEVIALMPMQGEEQAAALSQKALKQFSVSEEREPKRALYIGVARFPEQAESAEQLIERAEIALYCSRTGSSDSA